MGREINLGDYIKSGSDAATNRAGFLQALSDTRGQRIHKLYVPDQGFDYRIDIVAADKPTIAQLNAGEPGDSAIARFLVDYDLEIYGDGSKHSVLSFSSTDATLRYAAIKQSFPFSLTLRDVRLTNRRPNVTLFDAKNYDTQGVYVPSMTGNPTTQYELRLEKAKIDWFTNCITIPAGPSKTVNYLDTIVTDSEISAQFIGIACFTDPDSDGTKTLHVERSKLSNTDKHSGFGSHCIYAHPNVSFRSMNNKFFNWATAKFGLQHWGTKPNGRAKYAVFSGDYFDQSGDGFAIITSEVGPCTIENSVIECRQGVEVRQRATLSNVMFRPKPTITGSIAFIATPSGDGKVTARNVKCDMSFVGSMGASIFAVSNNNADWDIDGAEIYSTTPHNAVTIFQESANIGAQGPASVRAKNVTVNDYSVPDIDYAAGIRSQTIFVSAQQGTYVISDSSCKGDAANDRGLVRFDAGSVVQSVTFDNVDVLATRGQAVYVDVSGSDKLVARRSRFHGGRMQQMGQGTFQRVQFDERAATASISPTVMRRSTDWLPVNVLSIGTDLNVIHVAGSGSFDDICVNLRLKTQTKPASSGSVAITYTDVYSSEDTDMFVDGQLSIVRDADWSWRGTSVAAQVPLKLLRVPGAWKLG